MFLRRRPREGAASAGDLKDPIDAFDREFNRKRDAKDNERSIPPRDEHIDFSSVWVMECFTPSEVKELITRVEELTRPKARRGFPNSDVNQWLFENRWRPGSANYHLGI